MNYYPCGAEVTHEELDPEAYTTLPDPEAEEKLDAYYRQSTGCISKLKQKIINWMNT